MKPIWPEPEHIRHVLGEQIRDPFRGGGGDRLGNTPAVLQLWDPVGRQVYGQTCGQVADVVALEVQ